MKSYEAGATIKGDPEAFRTFALTPGSDGATVFKMRDEYTGPLLPRIWRSMPDLGPSFEQFANGLKARAEAADAGGKP